MIQATVNNTTNEIEVINENEVSINGDIISLDKIKLSDTKQHVLIDNKSYSVEFISFDKEKKNVTLKINNNPYTVLVKDKYDLLLKEMGMSNMTTKVVKEVKAPMPGLVVSVIATKGQEVKEGDSLLILEAMKMENVIKSPVDGVIKNIKIEETNTVEKNEILIEFE